MSQLYVTNLRKADALDLDSLVKLGMMAERKQEMVFRIDIDDSVIHVSARNRTEAKNILLDSAPVAEEYINFNLKKVNL